MAKKTKRKSATKKVKKSASTQLLSGPRISGLVQRKEVQVQDLKDVEDEVRDIINWVAIFEQEYDIPKEAVDTLLTRLHSVAKKVGWLHCH